MKHKKYGPYERFFKRPIDLVLAVLGLLILSPVVIIVAVLVKVKLGSPILFKQERVGKDEKIFKLYKFRTMTNQRGLDGELLLDSQRLTRFGKVLRQTSLDELPELINIIRGQMSIIGPRPLLVRYLPAYTEVERQRHAVRPGLSGLAQINGRNNVPWDERLAYDVEYVNKITFLNDFKIAIRTVLKVIKHDGVAANTEEIDEGYLDEIRGENGR